MRKDKIIIWLLLVNMLLQLGALILGVGLFLFAYIIAYLIAIIYSGIKISKYIMLYGSLKAPIYSLIFFFIANLILFLIYIPALLYNPGINWKLKGEVEQDPMILQAFVPPVLFVVSALVIILTTIVTKFFYAYKMKKIAQRDNQ